MLTVKNLTISFPQGPPVVDNLSFTLIKGDRLGLLGLSGSGKSMTAMAILGLLPSTATITQGEIIYTPEDGEPIDLVKLTEKEWRNIRGKEISLVFQEPQTALNPVHRIGRQLREGISKDQTKAKPETANETIAYWLNAVELGPESQRIQQAYPHELSGGQRQRVLIALALMSAPRLLIADEPTTALDTLTQDGILELLARLRKEHQLTTIFITHDLKVMTRSADNILVMAAGKEVKRVSKEELRQIGSAVFQSQAVGARNEEEKFYSATATQATALSVTDLSLAHPKNQSWWRGKATTEPIVKNVSFSVNQGEWVAIIGPSGCGKTSIARCLAGLLPIQSGTVELGEGGNVQLVFQDPFGSLNPAHNIAKALTEVLRVAQPNLASKTRQIQAAELLNSVGLPAEEYAKRYPRELSGGQRQRVAIARALAANPTILIADEAVSALDAPLRTEVLDLLDHLRRQRDLALLFISHDLALVAARADRVLVMDQGRIVEAGTTQQILRQPTSKMAQRLLASSNID